MIKKAYLKPSLEITEFKAEDIIRTSGASETKTANLTANFFGWSTDSGYSVEIK